MRQQILDEPMSRAAISPLRVVSRGLRIFCSYCPFEFP
jgi:hypothetical protein